jgi:hypothetical protein
MTWGYISSTVTLQSNNDICWTTLDTEGSLFGSIRRPS